LLEGLLRFETHADDPGETNGPPVLLLDPLEGDFLVETRVRLDRPEQGCCPHGLQAGLVVHGDDDNYVKLVLIRVHQTWHTEFAREMGPVPEDYPGYGNSVIGPPGEDWTWLRIAVRRQDGEELYTASTSRDGESWVRGTTWTHELGEGARIGLLAMGDEGFTAEFDYVWVSELGG
jgi:arabinan endo-1,5-alpha-L-arabinosidase